MLQFPNNSASNTDNKNIITVIFSAKRIRKIQPTCPRVDFSPTLTYRKFKVQIYPCIYTCILNSIDLTDSSIQQDKPLSLQVS